MTSPNHPILVTGAPRSGTTLVGKILCRAPRVAYIYEPFNVNQARGLCRAPLRYWFTYIDKHNAAAFEPGLRRTLRFRYDLLAQLTGMRRPKDLARLAIDSVQFAKGHLLRARPVMKDPIAVFSAEWLAETFAMDAVVMIRHPAGFVVSRKSRGDEHDFSHFTRQPALMDLLDDEVRRRVEDYANHPPGIVEQSALLWRMINERVKGYRERHPDWLFLRLEDLSEDPQAAFRRVFAHVGLPFTDDIRRTVDRYSSPGNPKQARQFGRWSGRTLKRNSKASARSWTKRLSEQEITTIRRIAAPIADAFYSDEEW